MSREGDGLVWISRKSLIRLKKDSSNIPLRAIRIRNRTGGTYLSRFKGRGMEFDETRPYMPGDDIRTLDWRVTARTGRPHTKLFREERERNIILWVDYRAPMHFATQGLFKSVLASQVAAMLAWSARFQGDRLGCLAFTETGHKELRPQSGNQAVLNLIGVLSDYSALRVEASSPNDRSQGMLNALIRLRRVTHPGSLLVLISDFRDLEASCKLHFSTLARNNDLILFRIFDRLEAELPIAGRYRISDGIKSLLLDTSNKTERRAYKERFESSCNSLAEICRKYRMHLLTCSTKDEPYEILRQGLGKSAT